MLVTRPAPDASDTAARLGALGIEPVLCPLLEFEALPTSLPDPRGFAAIAITSGNTLRALEQRGVLPGLLHLPVYAVGDRTAAMARALGFTRVQSANGAFADLVGLLAHSGIAGPVLYPTARDFAGDLAKSLAPYGLMVITARLYAMNAVTSLPEPVLADLQAGRLHAALFYSRRTAAAFVALTTALDRHLRTQLGMLCIAEAVAEPLIDAHFVRIGLAEHPSEEAMMGLALSFARDHNGS